MTQQRAHVVHLAVAGAGVAAGAIDFLHDDGGFGEAESAAAVFFGDQRGEPAGFGQGVDELFGIAALSSMSRKYSAGNGRRARGRRRGFRDVGRSCGCGGRWHPHYRTLRGDWIAEPGDDLRVTLGEGSTAQGRFMPNSLPGFDGRPERRVRGLLATSVHRARRRFRPRTKTQGSRCSVLRRQTDDSRRRIHFVQIAELVGFHNPQEREREDPLHPRYRGAHSEYSGRY